MTSAAVRPVAIKIDEDIKARVKRLADARQRTSHWLMRCLLYTSPSPRDVEESRMPSSA